MNALFDPEDEGNEHVPSVREPTARERRPVDNEPAPEPASHTLFMPLQEGNSWTYHLSYNQSSKVNTSMSVSYSGEEKWTCSLARYSDSTFVFQTFFNGEKTISGSNKEVIQGAYAYVTAKIINGALTLVREEGDLICPFWGDWLSLIGADFNVSYSSSHQIISVEKSGTNYSYAYTLDAAKGMTRGVVCKTSAYDSIKIEYILVEEN